MLGKKKRRSPKANRTPPRPDLIMIFFFSLSPFHSAHSRLSIRRRTCDSGFLCSPTPAHVHCSDMRKDETVSGHEWCLNGRDQIKHPLIASYLIRKITPVPPRRIPDLSLVSPLVAPSSEARTWQANGHEPGLDGNWPTKIRLEDLTPP